MGTGANFSGPKKMTVTFSRPEPGHGLLTIWVCGHIYGSMKTTIDRPDELLHRVKILAAQRQTTLKELVLAGLDWVLQSEVAASRRDEAMDRLKRGLHLAGKPLGRQEAHECR